MPPAETQPLNAQQDAAVRVGSTADVASPERSITPAFWRDGLARYEQANRGRALLDLATSALPYVVLSAVMYVALSVSYLLALALAVPTAVFLVRTFIVFHDCSHGSF